MDATDRRRARIIVTVSLVLSYLAVIEVWPRFLEGFADNLCADTACSDALFRSHAGPLGVAAFIAIVVASRLCADGSRHADLPLATVVALGVVLLSFLASPRTYAWHFLSGGLVAGLTGASIWRAAGGGWERPSWSDSSRRGRSSRSRSVIPFPA
jgi:di/tricarboxylate transporter